MGSRGVRIAVVAVAVGGFALYLFWPMISTLTKDPDSMGAFGVPGRAVVDLDEGRYGVYYREDRKLGTRPVGPRNQPVNESLPTPTGFEVSFRGLDGAPAPGYESVFDSVQTQGTGNITTKQVGRIEVTQDGRYEIATEGETKGLKASQVTLGEDRSRDDGWGRIRSLLKPIYIVPAAILLGLLRSGLFTRPRRRSAGIPPAASSPAAAPPPAPAPSTAPPADPIAELERLGKLRESGAIDDAEFERLKAELLR